MEKIVFIANHSSINPLTDNYIYNEVEDEKPLI